MANAFPAAMTRVGLLAGPHGVAIASTLGYGGFLLGPPAIGFLAGTLGLGPSLATVSLLALVAVAIAWFVTADAGRTAAATGERPARRRPKRNPMSPARCSTRRSAARPQAPVLAPTSSPHPRTPICDGACSRPLTGRPLLPTELPYDHNASAAIALREKI